MRLFHRWHTPEEVAERIVSGLKDGSLSLEAPPTVAKVSKIGEAIRLAGNRLFVAWCLGLILITVWWLRDGGPTLEMVLAVTTFSLTASSWFWPPPNEPGTRFRPLDMSEIFDQRSLWPRWWTLPRMIVFWFGLGLTCIATGALAGSSLASDETPTRLTISALFGAALLGASSRKMWFSSGESKAPPAPRSAK